MNWLKIYLKLLLIKRVYYIYGFESEKSIRGYHSHKTLEQVLFCISGSFTLILYDGHNHHEEKMNKPNIGLFIGKYCVPLIYLLVRSACSNNLAGINSPAFNKYRMNNIKNDCISLRSIRG